MQWLNYYLCWACQLCLHHYNKNKLADWHTLRHLRIGCHSNRHLGKLLVNQRLLTQLTCMQKLLRSLNSQAVDLVMVVLSSMETLVKTQTTPVTQRTLQRLEHQHGEEPFLSQAYMLRLHGLSSPVLPQISLPIDLHGQQHQQPHSLYSSQLFGNPFSCLMECYVYSFWNMYDPGTQSPWHWIQLRMQRHSDWAHSSLYGRTVQSPSHVEAHTTVTANAR